MKFALSLSFFICVVTDKQKKKKIMSVYVILKSSLPWLSVYIYSIDDMCEIRNAIKSICANVLELFSLISTITMQIKVA